MKVFDSRPSREAMLARCKRDKIAIESLVEVIAPQRHYAIRCYGLPTKTVVFEADGPHEVPAFILYSTRRDGKVSNGWGLPREASKVEVVA